MPVINILPTLLFAFVLTAVGGGLDAQSFAPPAEQPPQGFEGTQFVDSKGCIYIRAGVAGAVTWVPRVTRDRRQLCGQTPTFRAETVEAAAAPAPQVPEVQIISGERSKAKSPAAGRAASEPRVSASSAVVVTEVVPAGTADIAPDTRILPSHLYAARKSERPVKTPKGFRPAWQDDRLNLRRAEQTPAGQEQMRQIWTDTVPRRLIGQ